tara:strand:- start:402 stop:638 length:237 start_codon:yes stop_codon:yes gene_type:complete
MTNKKKNTNNNSQQDLFNEWPYGKKNYIIFSLGLALLIISYILMASGSVNSVQSLVISPILLILGYLVIIPVALLYKE